MHLKAVIKDADKEEQAYDKCKKLIKRINPINDHIDQHRDVDDQQQDNNDHKYQSFHKLLPVIIVITNITGLTFMKDAMIYPGKAGFLFKE